MARKELYFSFIWIFGARIFCLMTRSKRLFFDIFGGSTVAECPRMQRIGGRMLHSLHRETRRDVLHRRPRDQPFVEGVEFGHVGDSDAHIVRGLIAILFAIFSGRRAADILAVDAVALFEKMGLREHLTPQRSNGFRSMVERIRTDARSALAA